MLRWTGIANGYSGEGAKSDMLTAILGFLSSAFFRAAFERFANYFESKQDFEREMATMRLQFELDQKRAELQLDRAKVEFSAKEAAEWMKAIAAAQVADSAPSGIRWVDAWNRSLRPGAATFVFTLYVISRIAEMFSSDSVAMTEFDQGLLSSIFGYIFMDRTLMYRAAGQVK